MESLIASKVTGKIERDKSINDAPQLTPAPVNDQVSECGEFKVPKIPKQKSKIKKR